VSDRTARLEVRLSPEERARLERAAAADGRTLSSAVRRALEEYEARVLGAQAAAAGDARSR
jgi:uncharacterized protein (DUF1778 family)